jgi:hypothetical protein
MSAITERTSPCRMVTGTTFSGLPMTLTKGKEPLLAPIEAVATSPQSAVTTEPSTLWPASLLPLESRLAP